MRNRERGKRRISVGGEKGGVEKEPESGGALA